MTIQEACDYILSLESDDEESENVEAIYIEPPPAEFIDSDNDDGEEDGCGDLGNLGPHHKQGNCQLVLKNCHVAEENCPQFELESTLCSIDFIWETASWKREPLF